VIAIAGVFLSAGLLLTRGNPHTPIQLDSTVIAPYPTGTADSSEVSGVAPPKANALTGYERSYVNDFAGRKLPPGWDVYTGVPGGDPGAQWGRKHVVVSGGLLRLNTWKDPAYHDEWVSGGLCQCGHAQTYGAYFVRSRVTGSGPTGVELLWPAGPGWPPEIDFNETGGGTNRSTATLHFGSTNQIDQRTMSINMKQWHTWGVIWSPGSITYTVDGHVWGTVTVPSEIPDEPMTLDLQQQASCTPGPAYVCPRSPQSMEIDWVAEYAPH
jgi:Glycosyl hydrolases family 16